MCTVYPTYVSISAFASSVGIPRGIASFAVGLIFFLITAVIKMYGLIFSKKKRERKKKKKKKKETY